MKHLSSHRGSALLVVLGMLSFMVISAVGFATYMRSARLPSSYLRRGVTSRELAKAALAEAMDIIDLSVGNNPYPGSGDDVIPGDTTGEARSKRIGPTSNPEFRTGSCYNYWYHHIFIGTNQWMTTSEDTVSTLTLEGLAYIPIPLVNAARRYSRMSIAGQWRELGFDSGRYAFCAIDVSDYFDVNRLKADTRRNTGVGRISMSYLFENDDHTAYNSGFGPTEWDSFMQHYLKSNTDDASLAQDSGLVDSAKVPLISIADLNLAMWDKLSVSPFCAYVEGQNSTFYGARSAAEASRYRSMKFVTDSYFPQDNDADILADAQDSGFQGSQVYDVASEDGQFFDSIDDSNQANNKSFMDIRQMSTPAISQTQSNLSKVDLACLYDYLDGDSVPVSLAIPCCERVPGVVGLEQSMNLSFTPKLNPTGSPVETEDDPANPQWKSIDQAYEAVFDGNLGTALSTCTLNALAVFPFLRAANNPTFTIDGCVKLFFCDNQTPNTRGNTYFRPVDTVEFENNGAGWRNGAWNIPIDSQSLSFSNVQDANSAVQSVSFAGLPQARQAGLNQALFTFAYRRWQQNIAARGDPPQWQDAQDQSHEPTILASLNGVTTECKCPPLKSDCTDIASGYETPQEFVKTLDNVLNGRGAGTDFYLNAAIYLRIKDQYGKVVDMVPATLEDDAYQNSSSSMSGAALRLVGSQLGSDGAIMSFTSGQSLKFEADFTDPTSPTWGNGATQVTATLSPGLLMCPDPRFNHAPENWYTGGTSLSASDWLSTSGAPQVGGEYDIFFNVSNCGYLQSIYELAYLPRISPNFSVSGGNSIVGALPNLGSTGGSVAATATDAAYKDFNWTTYSPYVKGSQTRDNFEKLGIVSISHGFKVNPATTDTESFMAALANTPVSWEFTGTNQNNECANMTAQTFNQDYAFNAMNSEQKDNVSWSDLTKIAEAMQDGFDSVDYDVNTLFRGNALEWYNDQSLSRLFGEDMTGSTKFYDVDRKMMYGFWHDCFANKQQLYLIFVRAEPMMMGGGAVGQTPPQLGAKAMALVWRDPRAPKDIAGTRTTDAGAPHKMRILFYRQFD